MVIGRPEHAETDLEGEFSDSNLIAITLDTPDTTRLTAEDLQSAGLPALDPATWTRSINPLFIAVTEASYP